MSINRYSNLSQAKFNPMSFQELSVLPFAQRQKHDAASAQAEQAGIIESQRMAADEEAVSSAINAYQAKTDDYINRLDSEGFSNTTKSDIRDLVRERKDLMSPTGIVGRKQAQYDRYVANMKQLDNDKKNISNYKYRALQNKAVEDYNTAIKNDPNASYQDVLAVKDYDYQKEARQIAKDVQGNPKILTQFGFTPIHGAPGQYWNSKTQTKYTGKGDISNTIQSILSQNQDVQADLYQRKELGMLGDASPQDYLKSVGDSFNSYGVYQQTKSRAGFTNQSEIKQLEDAKDPTSPTRYVYSPVKSREIAATSFISELQDIAGGKVKKELSPFIAKPLYSKNPNYAKEMAIYREAMEQSGKISSFETMTDEGKSQFTNISSKLENLVNPATGQTYLQPNATDAEKAGVVANYLEQYKDFAYLNPVVLPLANEGTIQSRMSLNTGESKKVNEGLKMSIDAGRVNTT